jgi:hypothetical protein
MFISYAVVAIVLSLALVISGAAKLAKQPRLVDGLVGQLGVPLPWFPALASAELAGAAGLIIGLWVPGLGIAAAIGVVLYFIGAITAHLRAGQKNISPPLPFLILGVAALVLRIASA